MKFTLTVENLVVNYGSRSVLKGVNLSLPSGSVVALIGPNGTGKSTLIRALSGVLPIHSGRMALNGQDLARMSPIQRARQIAVVPQARNLPPAFTAWETVLFGRTPHLNWLGQVSPQDDERVSQAMQRTDTLCLADRRMGELSGGEQQRVLLARALAQAAPILLLDEPTTHLDLQYQLNLLDLVTSLAHTDGYAIFLALHDLNLAARYADRIVLLHQGEVRAVGNPGEVLQAGTLSQVYQVPLQVISQGPGGWPWIGPAA
jgi:iron complex transport system ATP-binding protein